MLTPEHLLRAYAMGIFPMADRREDEDIRWIEPRLRGIMPLDNFHISRSLRKSLLRGAYSVHIDRDFAGTVRACADREETWISHRIAQLYQQLQEAGHAHSVEVWTDGRLIGGTYGVALGGAWFGESMFSRRTDASKIALTFLVHRLEQRGFRLFDTQFLTPHLASLGGQEIDQADYLARLDLALHHPADFAPHLPVPPAKEVVQSLVQDRTQTS